MYIHNEMVHHIKQKLRNTVVLEVLFMLNLLDMSFATDGFITSRFVAFPMFLRSAIL